MAPLRTLFAFLAVALAIAASPLDVREPLQVDEKRQCVICPSGWFCAGNQCVPFPKRDTVEAREPLQVDEKRQCVICPSGWFCAGNQCVPFPKRDAVDAREPHEIFPAYE